MINSRVQNQVPNSSIREISGTSSYINIAVGNPIGLLLALTYAAAFQTNIPVYLNIHTKIKNINPSSRIK